MNRNMLVGRLKRLVRMMGELEDIADESWRFEDHYRAQVFLAYESARKRAGHLFGKARRAHPRNAFVRYLEYENFEKICSVPLRPYDFGDY